MHKLRNRGGGGEVSPNDSGSNLQRGNSGLSNININQYLVLCLRVTDKDKQFSYLGVMKTLYMLSLCEATITSLNNWRCDRWWAIPALQNYPHYRRLDRLTLIIILRAMDIWITSPRDGWISTNAAEILTKTFDIFFLGYLKIIWEQELWHIFGPNIWQYVFIGYWLIPRAILRR